VRHESGQGHLVGIVFGSGLFVALGTEAILTSADGDNWVSRLIEGFDSIAYGNGQFVAVGNGLDITSTATSADGVTWISSWFSGLGASARAIAYGAGYFVISSNDAIWTLAQGAYLIRHSQSLDGLFPGADRPSWRIAYGNGHFVAVGPGGNIAESGSVVALRIILNVVSGSLCLSLEGPTGLNYTIQTSSDLASWQDVTKITNAPADIGITNDLPAASSHQFYRATSQ
jgi:hypothetical protein